MRMERPLVPKTAIAKIRRTLTKRLPQEVAEKTVVLIQKALEQFITLHNDYYAPDYQYYKIRLFDVVRLTPSQTLAMLAILRHEAEYPAERAIPPSEKVFENFWIPIAYIFVGLAEDLETKEKTVVTRYKLWNFAKRLECKGTENMPDVFEEQENADFMKRQWAVFNTAVKIELYFWWSDYAKLPKSLYTFGKLVDDYGVLLIITEDEIIAFMLLFKAFELGDQQQ